MSTTTDTRAILQTIVKHMAVDGGPVAAAVATLATIVEELLPPEVPTVQCPACQQMVIPGPDGTLPGHDIAPGPRRSPRCRFRGRVTPDDHSLCLPGDCDLLAEDLAHEVADAAGQILDRALPGRGSN